MALMTVADISSTLVAVAPVIGIVAFLGLVIGVFSRMIFPPRR